MATPIPYVIDDASSTGQLLTTAGANTIYSYSVRNPNNYIIYVKLYDKADPATVNPVTDVPAQTITVPARVGSALGVANSSGVTYAFTNGIVIRCVTGSLNSDTTTPARPPIIQLDIASASAPVNGLFSTLTDGATITMTCDPTISSQNASVTLGGNRTLAISGATSGMFGVLIVKQDGTGSRTLALPAGSKVVQGGAGAITLSTAASAIDVINWMYDGTNYFWGYGNTFS